MRGYVVFEILGRFPERFINLCVRQGRFLFGAKPEKDSFTAALLLSDYREIRPIARRSGVRLRIKERHGVPFILSRYRLRVGILVGMVLFVIVSLALQSFVWTVELHGVTTLSESVLIEKLREGGLYEGAYKKSLDLHYLERSLMQEMEEIGWMSINVIGTKAEVEIKEKEKKPPIINADEICNVKASHDGLILRMNTKQGTAKTSVGSAVIKGQLLVSGIVENSQEEVYFVRADAEVIAETHRQMTFEASTADEFKAPTDVSKRQKLIFYWFDIPFRFSSVSGEYSSRYVTEKIYLNNTCIELGTVTEFCTEYELKNYILSEEDAKKRLCADEAMYRLFALSECEEIKKTQKIKATENGYSMTVSYTCTEDIATSEKLVVN